MNLDKNSLAFKLLSEYATMTYNENHFKEEKNKWFWIKCGLNHAFVHAGVDTDQKLRFDIDINKNYKGYQNMNKLTFVAYFE